MRRLLTTLSLLVVAGAVLAPVAPSFAEVAGKPQTIAPPAAGSWQAADPFGEETATFKVTGGTNGKAPKVSRLQFQVVEQSNGYMCPAAGSVVAVKGSVKLNKGLKYGGDYSAAKSPWITAKDRKYDDASPNLLGMRTTPVSMSVGAESRGGELAMYFSKQRPSKPHDVEIALVLFQPGASDRSDGYCLYQVSGKPKK